MTGLDAGRLAEIARGIPRYNAAVGQVLYRIHRADKGALYYSRSSWSKTSAADASDAAYQRFG